MPARTTFGVVLPLPWVQELDALAAAENISKSQLTRQILAAGAAALYGKQLEDDVRAPASITGMGRPPVQIDPARRRAFLELYQVGFSLDDSATLACQLGHPTARGLLAEAGIETRSHGYKRKRLSLDEAIMLFRCEALPDEGLANVLGGVPVDVAVWLRQQHQ